MIDKSDIIIFYVEERENSGAYKAFKYATQKRKRLLTYWKKICDYRII